MPRPPYRAVVQRRRRRRPPATSARPAGPPGPSPRSDDQAASSSTSNAGSSYGMGGPQRASTTASRARAAAPSRSGSRRRPRSPLAPRWPGWRRAGRNVPLAVHRVRAPVVVPDVARSGLGQRVDQRLNLACGTNVDDLVERVDRVGDERPQVGEARARRPSTPRRRRGGRRLCARRTGRCRDGSAHGRPGPSAGRQRRSRPPGTAAGGAPPEVGTSSAIAWSTTAWTGSTAKSTRPAGLAARHHQADRVAVGRPPARVAVLDRCDQLGHRRSLCHDPDPIQATQAARPSD